MNYQGILLVPDILVPVAMVFEFYYKPEKGKERNSITYNKRSETESLGTDSNDLINQLKN